MGWFKKKKKPWWSEGHAPSDSLMAKVEQVLHDSWVAYHYNALFDRLLVAVQRTEDISKPLYAVINEGKKGCIKITSYTALPVAYKDVPNAVFDKLIEINETSEFINLQIDSRTKIVTSVITLGSKTPDAVHYVFPILLEQARIVDEQYLDYRSVCESPCISPYRLFWNYYDLQSFDSLPLNKVANINGDVAIIHQTKDKTT